MTVNFRYVYSFCHQFLVSSGFFWPTIGHEKKTLLSSICVLLIQRWFIGVHEGLKKCTRVLWFALWFRYWRPFLVDCGLRKWVASKAKVMDLHREKKLPIYVDFVLTKQRPKLWKQRDNICSGLMPQQWIRSECYTNRTRWIGRLKEHFFAFIRVLAILKSAVLNSFSPG